VTASSFADDVDGSADDEGFACDDAPVGVGTELVVPRPSIEELQPTARPGSHTQAFT
jgi:hypothetical protein